MIAGRRRILRLVPSWGTCAIAGASTVVIWLAWGSIRPEPNINDEFSYLLQANIFAHGMWTAPAPPVPEFFYQPHVLVTPHVASKYFPGHALLLALGSVCRAPQAVPLMLGALSGSLLFWLVTEALNSMAAVFAWLIWISTPLVLQYQASYMSEVSSETLVLLSWMFLWKWRKTRSREWMCALALAVGWGALTRPLTMLAFAIPIGAVVIPAAGRDRRAGQLLLGLAVGLLTLCIIPLWNKETTGDSALTPLSLYTREFLPVEKLGFSVDTTAPRAALPPPLRGIYLANLRLHRGTERSSVTSIVAARLQALRADLFPGPRIIIVLAALVGTLNLSAPLMFAVVSIVCLFISYLFHAGGGSPVYYLEATPALSALAAHGIIRTGRLWANREVAIRVFSAVVAGAIAIDAAQGVSTAQRWHARYLRNEIEEWLTQLPRTPAIVFVRYACSECAYVNLVQNFVNVNVAPIWIVTDLGARDADLARLAPWRATYTIDADAFGLQIGEP